MSRTAVDEYASYGSGSSSGRPYANGSGGSLSRSQQQQQQFSAANNPRQRPPAHARHTPQAGGAACVDGPSSWGTSRGDMPGEHGGRKPQSLPVTASADTAAGWSGPSNTLSGGAGPHSGSRSTQHHAARTATANSGYGARPTSTGWQEQAHTPRAGGSHHHHTGTSGSSSSSLPSNGAGMQRSQQQQHFPPPAPASFTIPQPRTMHHHQRNSNPVFASVGSVPTPIGSFDNSRLRGAHHHAHHMPPGRLLVPGGGGGLSVDDSTPLLVPTGGAEAFPELLSLEELDETENRHHPSHTNHRQQHRDAATLAPPQPPTRNHRRNRRGGGGGGGGPRSKMLLGPKPEAPRGPDSDAELRRLAPLLERAIAAIMHQQQQVCPVFLISPTARNAGGGSRGGTPSLPAGLASPRFSPQGSVTDRPGGSNSSSLPSGHPGGNKVSLLRAVVTPVGGTAPRPAASSSMPASLTLSASNGRQHQQLLQPAAAGPAADGAGPRAEPLRVLSDPDAVLTTRSVHTLIHDLVSKIDYGGYASLVFIAAMAYLSRVPPSCGLTCAVHSPHAGGLGSGGGVDMSTGAVSSLDGVPGGCSCSDAHCAITEQNWFRFTLVAILVATKVHAERSCGTKVNARFAKASGVSLADLRQLELEFLFLLDFSLSITEEEFESWSSWVNQLDGWTPGMTVVSPSDTPTSLSLASPRSQSGNNSPSAVRLRSGSKGGADDSLTGFPDAPTGRLFSVLNGQEPADALSDGGSRSGAETPPTPPAHENSPPLFFQKQPRLGQRDGDEHDQGDSSRSNPRDPSLQQHVEGDAPREAPPSSSARQRLIASLSPFSLTRRASSGLDEPGGKDAGAGGGGRPSLALGASAAGSVAYELWDRLRQRLPSPPDSPLLATMQRLPQQFFGAAKNVISSLSSRGKGGGRLKGSVGGTSSGDEEPPPRIPTLLQCLPEF